MGSEHEDQVRTLSAAASAAPPGRTADPPGATLGRYRLERELGAGAMGVVHAAFDPDLERRVALKVLRDATDSRVARERLLREARAMARLAHPNVVTVYEVGTASGRDFVAMELIQGESLADWLRASRRRPAVILDAFVAAGRGLAAAHAAGIVHRDFKPHNVLRSRDGRIAVTDFGLAREAEVGLPLELDATLPIGAARGPASTPPEITVTGALLGTPAYMAPEQWRGEIVTPATDQFAYCVALWEALAGDRPYRGPGLDELRDQIARGPGAIDASRIPRRLRGVLRRGLDPDPARRWPSMQVLLGQLVRARRRSRVALAIAGAALAAAIGLVAALVPDQAPALACDPPGLDVASVWSPAIAAELRARTSDAHARVLDAAYHEWQLARVAACHAAPQVKHAQALCLDGVLRRFDAVRAAHQRVPEAAAEEIQAQLVDPAVCRAPAAERIPRLTLAATPDVVAAYELLARSSTDARPSERQLADLAGARAANPCARIIATLAFAAVSSDVAQTRALMSSAVGLSEPCGDERVRAELLIQDSQYHWQLLANGKTGESAFERAEHAAARVMQPELAAGLATQRVLLAQLRSRWDEALRMADVAVAGYRAHGLQVRQLRAVILRDGVRVRRAEPEDLAAVGGDVQIWRPVAVAARQGELVRRLDVLAAMARFLLGDVRAAHAELLGLWRAQPRPAPLAGARRITGVVVDTAGRPVAGATVAASNELVADSSGIAMPELFPGDTFQDPALRMVTSDDTGHFVIEDAPPLGVIAAELADRRAMPAKIAARVTLTLEPTRRITGHVDLPQISHTRVAVQCAPVGDAIRKFAIVAPIARDGSFVIDGAPTRALRLRVPFSTDSDFATLNEFQTIPASTASISGIRIGPAAASRSVDVIVRSTITTPLQGASVVVLPGEHSIRLGGDLERLLTAWTLYRQATPVAEGHAPRAVLDRLRGGDLVAHFEGARPGQLTACAISWTDDPLDEDLTRRQFAHFSQFAVGCRPIGPHDAVVEVEAPPQQRF